MRLFNVFCITFPPEESIRRIYATILQVRVRVRVGVRVRVRVRAHLRHHPPG